MVSFNPKNSNLSSALGSMMPMHTSKDEAHGRKETSKLFPRLKLSAVEETKPEQFVEKFLARQKRRIISLHALYDDGEPLEPVVVIHHKKKSEGGEDPVEEDHTTHSAPHQPEHTETHTVKHNEGGKQFCFNCYYFNFY